MTRWVGVLFAVALGGWGRAAQAQTTMGFIISGDCRDPDLAQNARQLARELKASLGDRLVSDDAVRARLSPQPTVNADDLGRQLEVAETHFYNGEYAKSEAAILHALEEIRRFPPGPERWKLTVKAELLQSQVIRRLGRIAEADELFRHVLRLQPSYQLDPDYFMPSI
ncbi:MAG TPA: tetratricopeptide repeat protein, partial [Myxococcaceae bacterium]